MGRQFEAVDFLTIQYMWNKYNLLLFSLNMIKLQ